MPKSINVDPERTRLPDHLELPDIPVHRYDTPFAEELESHGRRSLVELLRHMMILRSFESGLAALKSTGKFGHLEYTYKGPAHLSIGQEAAAVGAALALTPNDHIFGSHRSHGEFLAKGLRAIAVMDEADLTAIMEEHDDGKLRDAVTARLDCRGVRDKAERFLLLGFLAEIFMRSNGFNGGMGGSMHAFFLPFGAYPNNAIVGASAGIATGAALQMKVERRKTIAVAMVGDGATGCGPVWEAMNFAAMAQFDQLWDEKGGLPILFFFTNNFYAMGGQTSGETMAWDRLSQIGAGLRRDACHAETVDGTNPLAVADAVARKRSLLMAQRGPALLDVECYRYSGHSTTDVNAYRTKEEIALWRLVDPIQQMQARLARADILRTEQATEMQAGIENLMHDVFHAAADPDVCPRVDPAAIGQKMFSDLKSPYTGTLPRPLCEPESVPRLRQTAKKTRRGRSESGELLSPMRAMTLRDGLFESVLHHVLNDQRVILYGEECREWGGAFGVYRGLSDLIPHDRLFNAPISEAAIVATAVGAAIEGGRPIIELMYADFIGRAGDEIFNQLAKWQAMSNGHLSLPVVLRTSVGSKYGAQHSQDWTGLAMHIPGLKVIYPATPYDAKGLLSAAIACDDPVLVFESQRLYDKTELFADSVPEGDYQLPIGVPDIKRAGEDVTVLTIGPSLYPALDAAETLSQQGISIEIIDARSLVPFEYDSVLESVAKTGRFLVVTEACERGSAAMTLTSNVAYFAFTQLKSPPRLLGSPNWIVPGADMEGAYFPQAVDVVRMVSEMMANAGGHRRDSERLRLARCGL